MRRRVLIAVIIGIVGALVCAWLIYPALYIAPAEDLTWLLIGAAWFASGHNPWTDSTPYRWLRPDPQFWPLYYPLPALVVVAPDRLDPPTTRSHRHARRSCVLRAS